MVTSIILIAIYFFILALLAERILTYTKIKISTKWGSTVIVILFIISVFLEYQRYTHSNLYRYIDKDNTVAEKGIFLKNKVFLSEYRKVSTDDYIIFKTNNYTRSDRHNELIQIIDNGRSDDDKN